MENQIKMDARKSPSALFEIRKQIVRLHKKGVGPMAIPSLPVENSKIVFSTKPACVFRLRAS